MSDGQQKNLPATARKKHKAREEGQVARSRDLANFIAISVCGALMVVFASDVAEWLKRLLAEGLSFDNATIANPGYMFERLGTMGLKLLLVIVPLGCVMAFVGIVSASLSGGWNFTTKIMNFNLGKLSPMAGFGRMFSKNRFVELAKDILLAVILGFIGYLYFKAKLPVFVEAQAMELTGGIAHVLSEIKGGLVLLVLALALSAVIDVPLQRWQLATRLKMSHQEVKQEHKDVEGDQRIKGKIKVRMREIARKRMLAAVPNADLVVMNPTHYAVALKYDDSMAAPIVVAKGADLFAMRIRDLAREHKVPVLQAPPLARALYAHAEVDREIPAALFAAVAQVLAYVYQLKASFAPAGGDHTMGALPVPKELDPHEPGAKRATARD